MEKKLSNEVKEHMSSLITQGYSASDIIKEIEQANKTVKVATGFYKTGNNFNQGPPPSPKNNYHPILPVGTYSLNRNCGGYFLKKIDDFTITSKLYGDLSKNADRIYNTFMDRESSTGALLCGVKGTGKTLSTKYISMKASKQGIPTIVINSPYSGEAFNDFIQQIAQPCVIIFDEYEKVYRRQQEALLTLLDGVYPTKKLFLLTSNNRKQVGGNMMNRPGRLFYVLEFHGVNWELIKEYFEENLKDKSHIEKATAIVIMMNRPNFDMIKALVEEMNRYDESPVEALKLLNIRPQFDGDNARDHYNIEFFKGDGNGIKKYTWFGNPIVDKIKFDNGDDFHLDCAYFVKVDAKDRSLWFEKDGCKVKLTVDLKTEFTWSKIGSNASLTNNLGKIAIGGGKKRSSKEVEGGRKSLKTSCHC